MFFSQLVATGMGWQSLAQVVLVEFDAHVGNAARVWSSWLQEWQSLTQVLVEFDAHAGKAAYIDKSRLGLGTDPMKNMRGGAGPSEPAPAVGDDPKPESPQVSPRYTL